MEKWIIFDVMGVVFPVGDDTNDLLVPFIQKKNPEITREYIVDIYMDASFGKISSDEFWAKMNLCNHENNIKMCMEYLDTCFEVDPNFLKTAKTLKKQYKLALLSNDISEWSQYLRNKFGLSDLVEFSIISGDVKLRKPSCEIYQLAIEKAKADAKDCIFIDDRYKNLLAATKEGMNIIHFQRDDEGIDDIISIKSFLELEKAVDRVWADNKC